MMPVEAVVLGAVQGVTEFLPISSSGHLIIVHQIFGDTQASLFFDVSVHVATLAAVLVAFRSELREIVRGIFGGEKRVRAFVIFLACATLPAGFAGVLAGDWFEQQRSLLVVSVMLIAWGVVLILAENFSKKYPQKSLQDAYLGTSFRDTMLLGFAQVLALIPGTSRSGITMSAGLFLGMPKESAAKISFLLAIPTILGASLVTFMHAPTLQDGALGSVLLGGISAFITGLLAIRLLFLVLHRGGLRFFGIYRIVLGVGILFAWYLF